MTKKVKVMKYSMPESKGIKSEWIYNYVKLLEDRRLATHDLIILKDGDIIYEAYWKPFNKESLHRQYSVSKSFVGIAIGFLEQDGLISLDDTVLKLFPEYLENCTDDNLRNMTVRNMLMMATAKPPQGWFEARTDDRVKFYFSNTNPESYPAGKLFWYDSTGSFVLGALVERITGKLLIEYLREKLFDKIGVSDTAYCLKCPGGHSWGDSAVLCTARDLALVAQFMLNGGEWKGEQILNRDYVTAATSKQIDNCTYGDNEFESQGYGYQIWRTLDNSFFFNGMGCQLAICVPDKNIVLVYNGNNLSYAHAKGLIVENFFDMIVRPAVDSALPENKESQRKLADYTKKLSLYAIKGESHSAVCDTVNNKTYKLDKNPMGISKIRFKFTDNGGVMYYTNEQGDKEIPFGWQRNEFSLFPERGYSDEVGSVSSDILYKCATSAAWTKPDSLHIKVQIIDKYLGVLDMKFGFADDKIAVQMFKVAEDCLHKYQGFAGGQAINKGLQL